MGSTLSNSLGSLKMKKILRHSKPKIPFKLSKKVGQCTFALAHLYEIMLR